MLHLVVSLLGCTHPQPVYYEGLSLASIEFVYVSPEHGTHPNTGILSDSNNPFAGSALWDDKWDVETYGHPPASYYAWATQLAVEPVGENQYYTASALTSMYNFQTVDLDYLPLVWKMAVNAHLSILENFPHSVSYLADEITSFQLAPLSYEALELLGADLSGWTMVTADDGTVLILPTGEQ